MFELSREAPGLVALGVFLQKWNCPAHLENLFRVVELRVLQEKVSPLRVFRFAAILDNLEIAKAALTQTTWGWQELPPSDQAQKSDKARSSDQPIIGGSIWDTSTWSVWWWRNMMNMDYVFALVRAYRDVQHSPTLPDKFEEYLLIAKAQT